MKDFYKKITPEELERYASEAGLGGKSPADLQELVKIIPKNASVLEVGCGTGRLGKHLFVLFDYEGIDSYKAYLEYFVAVLRDNKVSGFEKKIHCVDFFDYNGGKFDVILFPWTVIGDFDKKGQIGAIKKSREMLNKGGMLILDNPAKETIYNQKKGYKPVRFYYDDWEDQFSKLGFPRSKKILYNTPNGKRREITVLGL